MARSLNNLAILIAGLSIWALAILKRKTGDSDTAVSQYREALAIFEKKLSPSHGYRVRVRRALVSLLRETGRVAEADELEQQSL